MRHALRLVAVGLALSACQVIGPSPGYKPLAGRDYVAGQVVLTAKRGVTREQLAQWGGEVGAELTDYRVLPGQGTGACGQVFAAYRTSQDPQEASARLAARGGDDLFAVNPN